MANYQEEQFNDSQSLISPLSSIGRRSVDIDFIRFSELQPPHLFPEMPVYREQDSTSEVELLEIGRNSLEDVLQHEGRRNDSLLHSRQFIHRKPVPTQKLFKCCPQSFQTRVLQGASRCFLLLKESLSILPRLPTRRDCRNDGHKCFAKFRQRH